MSGSHRVFISAAPADQKWRAKLRKHLCILKGIEVRSDDDVAPGDDQQVAIVDELSRADIILVLISPDYFNSTKHRDIHLPLALQRHQRKQARVIPIPLRPCVWKDGPIGSLQCLPRNEQYVSIGKSESVLAGIAAELRELLGGERARSVEERGHLLALGREDLLSRVESVSALKDGVKQVRRMDCAEPFRSFLDISFEKDGMTLQHPVVAVEQGVGEALVQALEQGLHTEYPRNAPPSVIVYEGPRAPDTLVQRANRAGITISHFDDYSRLIDFNEYLRRQTARLESDQIYPPRLYVGQKADLLEPITGHAPDALTTLADWLAKEGPRFVLLLGDFGTGKTFLLHELARSPSLWERRIAVVATLAFIRAGELDDTYRLALALADDPHDLIHKACGWMLREVGKKNKTMLIAFLNKHARELPRTALRYAIEHFPEAERQRWLQKR